MKIFKRKILFFIDNAGSHSITDEPKKKIIHVEFEYFSQPLDMIIIDYFKALVRH